MYFHLTVDGVHGVSATFLSSHGRWPERA